MGLIVFGVIHAQGWASAATIGALAVGVAVLACWSSLRRPADRAHRTRALLDTWSRNHARHGARCLVRMRYGDSRSVRVTGRSPRLARPRKIAGNAITVPECPRCMLTIDPGRVDLSTADTIASGPGSV